MCFFHSMTYVLTDNCFSPHMPQHLWNYYFNSCSVHVGHLPSTPIHGMASPPFPSKRWTPPHYNNIVHEALSNRLPGCWMGREHPIIWIQRISDLTLGHAAWAQTSHRLDICCATKGVHVKIYQ